MSDACDEKSIWSMITNSLLVKHSASWVSRHEAGCPRWRFRLSNHTPMQTRHHQLRRTETSFKCKQTADNYIKSWSRAVHGCLHWIPRHVTHWWQKWQPSSSSGGTSPEKMSAERSSNCFNGVLNRTWRSKVYKQRTRARTQYHNDGGDVTYVQQNTAERNDCHISSIDGMSQCATEHTAYHDARLNRTNSTWFSPLTSCQDYASNDADTTDRSSIVLQPTQSVPVQELSSCWDGRPFGHNKHGPRSWGLLCPTLWGEGAGSPSNTMSPGPRPISVPSGILIHLAIWPQYTWTKK